MKQPCTLPPSQHVSFPASSFLCLSPPMTLVSSLPLETDFLTLSQSLFITEWFSVLMPTTDIATEAGRFLGAALIG